MNVNHTETGELTRKLTVSISKEDYAEGLRRKLSARRRNAEFKGFRRGMAPMSLIQRVYGEQCLVEAVNDIITQQLDSYIKDNKIRVLGEPLASEDQPKVEWKDGNDFTFSFDIASRPEISFEIGKDDKVPYYDIAVTDEAKKEMKDNILRQLGSFQEGEAAKEDDYVIADMSNAAGVSVEGAYVSIRSVEGAARDKFLGAKVDDKFEVNVNEAFTNETDRASMLKLKKDDLAALDPVFNVTIVNVKTFVPAEANQETFDKAFGEGKVHDEEEFDKAVEERLKENYREEADYRLSKDIRACLVKKAGISLPEDFLKRWLLDVNEGKFTKEDIEKDFPAFIEDFKWQLIRDYVMEKNSLKVEAKDMQEAAEAFVAYQYASYGMGGVPKEYIKGAAEDLLKKEDQARNIMGQVENQKVIAAVREAVSLTHKKISVDKFRTLE